MKELIIVVLALMSLGVVIFGLICVWYFVTEKKEKDIMEVNNGREKDSFGEQGYCVDVDDYDSDID